MERSAESHALLAPPAHLPDGSPRRPASLPSPTYLLRRLQRGKATLHFQPLMGSLLPPTLCLYIPPSLALTALRANPGGGGGLRGTFSSSGNSTSFSVVFAFLPPHSRWALSSLSWFRLFSCLCFLSKRHLTGVHGYRMPARDPPGSAIGVRRPQYTEVKSPRKVGSSTAICVFVHLSI